LNGENFSNYFNYFTEIEEHFQRARGTSLFLLSPLDWALIETWKNSGVPLEAVLRGIDEAFEKWRSRKSRMQMVNSIAYCAQAVMKEAQRLADSGQGQGQGGENAVREEAAPFPPDAVRHHIEDAAKAVGHAGVDFLPVKESLDQILADLPAISVDLEVLEQRLTSLEQKLVAIIRAKQTDLQALEIRQKLESHLRPWRSKMTAPQIAMLEVQYLDRATLESAGLPRLSLFYLR
jgi:uncharacterized protein YhaN